MRLRAAFFAVVLALEPATSGCSRPARIAHVVVVVQENRSFDTIFMGYPGADTATSGACKPNPRLRLCLNRRRIPLKPITLETCRCLGGTDIQHDHASFELEYDGGKMDGFDSIGMGTVGLNRPAGLYPYAYVVRRETAPYWDLARQYVLADATFSTATTNSFVAHQQLIAGTTRLNDDESLTDVPNGYPWGCDAPSGTRTAVIARTGRVSETGPFPCLTQYRTMADVFDAARVSWKYYVAPYRDDLSGGNWNAFDAIRSVRYGNDWKAHVAMPNTAFFDDVRGGTLPQVSWVIPALADSDHPLAGANSGPSWVAAIVNAVGASRYWNDTAIVVVWDDWGGFYDHVAPPQINYTSLGMRVPMLVVSAWAKRGYVSHTRYDFGSILKYVERTFGTASLGTSDAASNSLDDAFDFTRSPASFQPIAAPYPTAYFLRSRRFPAPEAVMRTIVHQR